MRRQGDPHRLANGSHVGKQGPRRYTAPRRAGETPRAAGPCAPGRHARDPAPPAQIPWEPGRPYDGAYAHALQRQLQHPPDPRGRRQDLQLLQPQGGGGSGPARVAPAQLHEGAAREPAPQRGPDRRGGGHPRPGRLRHHQGPGGARDRFPPRPRVDAGLHGRAGGGGPRRHARRHAHAGRRPGQDQPAEPRRPRDRPLRDGGLLRHGVVGGGEQGPGVRAQRRALSLPALGLLGLPRLPRGAAGHGHLPPGEPGVPGADRLEPARGAGRGRPRRRRGRCGVGRDPGLPRHGGRHRQPHDHGQRPLRARLGRGRDRGGGGHAGPADPHAHPRGCGHAPDRPAERGRDGHRPGADGHADAPPQGRGGQVRRVLRRRAGLHDHRGPGDHRQHGPRIRRHLRLLPDLRRHAEVPARDRPHARARGAGRGLRQGAGPVPRPGRARARVHRHAGARHLHGGELARRAQAPAGPRAAVRRGRVLRRPPAHRLRQGRPRGRARAGEAGRGAGRRSTSATATW